MHNSVVQKHEENGSLGFPPQITNVDKRWVTPGVTGRAGVRSLVPVTSVLPTGVTKLTKKNLYVLYVTFSKETGVEASVYKVLVFGNIRFSLLHLI